MISNKVIRELYEKNEHTGFTLARAVSNFLFDSAQSDTVLSNAQILESSKYNTIKKLTKEFLIGKSYYILMGVICPDDLIEKLSKDEFVNQNLYFDSYGNAYIYNKGLFHPFNLDPNDQNEYLIKTYEDFV